MTYRELHRNELTWIASHVAGDMLAMHDPNDQVSDFDLAKIADARQRDAAIATLPSESNNIVPVSRRS